MLMVSGDVRTLGIREKKDSKSNWISENNELNRHSVKSGRSSLFKTEGSRKEVEG